MITAQILASHSLVTRGSSIFYDLDYSCGFMPFRVSGLNQSAGRQDLRRSRFMKRALCYVTDEDWFGARRERRYT